MKLSQRRAQSVANYLKRKGVTNRLTAKGYGETQPIADNSTEAGRSENRRVELIWIED
jgi:OOP family OmpA-OmpF porin